MEMTKLIFIHRLCQYMETLSNKLNYLSNYFAKHETFFNLGLATYRTPKNTLAAAVQNSQKIDAAQMSFRGKQF